MARLSKTRDSASDYFLASKKLPWYAVGASFVASNISTEHFIGTVGWGFLYGMAVANWEWGNAITFTALIWIFLPFYTQYVLGLESWAQWVGLLLLAYFGSGFLALPVWLRLARRFGKKPTWLSNYVLGMTASLSLFFLPTLFTGEQFTDDVLDAIAEFFLGLLESHHAQEKPAAVLLREVGDSFLEVLHSHRNHVLVWLEWGSAVREDVWPKYRAFTEHAVGFTRRTIERGQREGVVPADADTESLARLFASSSQSIARLQLGDVEPDTVRRFQDTVLRAILVEDAVPA